jgi:hypothetical protein
MSDFFPDTLIQSGASQANSELSGIPLRRLLRADQCACWRRGQRVLVETYLPRFPALATDPQALLDVLITEMLCGRPRARR